MDKKIGEPTCRGTAKKGGHCKLEREGKLRYEIVKAEKFNVDLKGNGLLWYFEEANNK